VLGASSLQIFMEKTSRQRKLLTLGKKKES